MDKQYNTNWKRPGLHASDYSYSRDHNHDKRQYEGLGPSGYRRSDLRIQEDVCEALLWNSEVDATDIEVTVEKGIVSLRGFVDSRHSKRIAERAIEHISGVEDVRNMLILKRHLDLEEDKIIARGDDGLFTQEIQKK